MSEIKKAIKKAWEEWHKGIDADLIPGPTMTFERGFKAGAEYVEKRAAELERANNERLYK